MSKHVVIGGVAILLIVVGMMFLIPSMKKPTPEIVAPTATVTTPSATVVAPSVAVEKVQEVAVIAKEFMFNQSTITVTSGQKVKLTLDNAGQMPHNFVVDELKVKTKTVSAGGTDVVEFTPTQKGTFSFYCSIGQHRAKGMEGKIVVE